MFTIDLKGVVSLTFNGISIRGMLDYGIKYDFANYSSFDVQARGDGNYVIIYPSGGKQTLFTIK